MSNTITDNNFFERYTSLVGKQNINEAFILQDEALKVFYTNITEQKAMYAYAKGKWTLKEMLQHIIDTERIFAYRALCIARNEKAVLPGFDENDYANNANANNRTWANLVDEMIVVRKSTQHLYQSFTEDVLQNIGQFSQATDSVYNIGLIIIGHIYHHLKIVEERYL